MAKKGYVFLNAKCSISRFRVQSSINKAPKRVSFLLSKTKLAADARALFYLVKMKLPIIEELELFFNPGIAIIHTHLW